MPKDRLSFQDIQSWTPAIDIRAIAEGKTFVLDGKNYAFDSKGPKSAFASRLLNNGDPIETGFNMFGVQSLGGFIFTSSKIGRFSSNGTFLTVYEYVATLVGDFVHRTWTRAVFGTAVYYCHPGTGILKFNSLTNAWTTFDPGITSPMAICESNGRLIVLGSIDVAWSAPDDPEDFTPALGGAGAQSINQRIAGSPFALMALASGYIVWTTQGALVGEYIGGDTVFRHYVAEHQHIPLNDSAITRLDGGSYIICTQQGLFLYPYSGTPESLTPVFNEFLRSEILRNSAGGYDVHLIYISEEDRLYVQTREFTNWHTRTYVLSVSLDRWGEFSKQHFGIIQHGIDTEPFDGVTGYVDLMGRAHRFMLYGTNCETSIGEFEALDSYITLGPFRSPALQPVSDATQELQGLVLSSAARPSWFQPPVEDLMLLEGEEDLLALPDSIEDEHSYNMAVPEYSYNVLCIGDLAGADEVDSDDVDSENSSVIAEVPDLVRETAKSRYYTTLVPGVWHRVRISATELDEYFHVTFGELTLSYAGRITP